MELELHRLELTYQRLRRHDARRAAQLVASICEQGQQSPVVVVEQAGQPGRYVLIDGYQRVAALEKLGRNTVSAVVLALDEIEALCLTHRLEGAQRRCALEQGWLLLELVERGVSQEKLALRLSHSGSWVSRRLGLVRELPEQAQDLVRKGQLCPYGAMRHLLPLARAKRKDCERLVERLAESTTTSVSARQLGRLVLAWRSADAAERQRIVEQPLLYLRAEQAVTAPAEEPSPERQLRSDLEAVGAIARRASGRLDDNRALADRLPMVLDRVWRQTRLAFDELEQRMEGRLDAGPGHAAGRLRPQGQGPRHQGDRARTEGLQEHGAPDPA
jgi:ParB/RepB/Spo0J family partition protein